MPLKGEAKNEYNKRYAKEKKNEKEYNKQAEKVYEILHEIDGSGPRFRSEALSDSQLKALYQFFVYGHAILNMDVSFDHWLELRDRARKDLFWLGSVLGWLWYKHVHQQICDFFVQKNFDGVYHEGYTLKQVHNAIERQSICHHRLLLDPRYHYKTTINSVDSLQWMLNVPDIRLFIVTAEEENSDDFVRQIKGYLYQPKGAVLTDFQLMFPEYVLRGRDGSSVQPFVSPARRHAQKDPTLWADSIMATLATQHCDVMKADDVVSNRNSDSQEARAKLKKKFDQAIHLLDPHGFFDILGTRYSSDDWYAYRIKAEQEARDHGIENSLFVQVRSGWRVRDGFTDKGQAWKELPLKELKLDMVELLFPELKSTPQKTFEHFMVDVFNNETDFRAQILNEPAHDEDSPYINPFNSAILTKSTVLDFPPPSRDQGELGIWWDTALTDGKKSDYCAGVVWQIWQRPDEMWELFIWEIKAERMSTFDLAYNMVALSKKWNPLFTLFEQPKNLEMKDLGSALNKQKMMQGYDGAITPVSPDPHKNAKVNRIKGLEVLFRLRLIRFAHGPWLDLTFKQFQDFTGEPGRGNSGRKDDIPDAIGSVARRMPCIGLTPNPEAEAIKKEKEARDQRSTIRRMYDSIFSGGNTSVVSTGHQWLRDGLGPVSKNPVKPEEDDGIRGTFGIPFAPRYKNKG
jgi:phage terminase large subunit-like protein